MYRSKERGEGKIGCVLSLLVLIGGIAVGAKVLPVLYGNYSLAQSASDLAEKAGIFKLDGMVGELRDKARDLGVTEALAPGAMTISATGNPTDGGICTIHLLYTRNVDLYGFYKFDIHTDDTIVRKFIDAR